MWVKSKETSMLNSLQSSSNYEIKGLAPDVRTVFPLTLPYRPLLQSITMMLF
jgi:hypothetical protein